MGGFVGQDGIDLAIGQARLIEAHVCTEVVGEEHVFPRMLQLVPIAVVAYLLLVLLTQGLTVKPITSRKRGDADGGRLNLLLLKKRRTLR